MRDDLHENLKLQAQCHAQEARTANSTINEIYQLCTGARGEPGTWHGAEPVRKAIAREREAAVREERERIATKLEQMESDFYGDELGIVVQEFIDRLRSKGEKE